MLSNHNIPDRHQMSISIEFSPPHNTGPCECCGGTTTSLTRFVYKRGDAYAIYYVRFADSHPDRVVLAAVSIGEWGTESEPSQRTAFALSLRAGPDNYEVMVCDARTSPWRHAELLGTMLDRREALEHPRLRDVFEITDQAIADDVPLRMYLDEVDSENGR